MGKELAIAPFNYMAIGSGWVGSQAVNETGQRWMSAARTAVRLGAAGWMSEMVGRSTFNTYMIVGSGRNNWSDSSVSYGFNNDNWGVWGTLNPSSFAGRTFWSLSYQNNDYIFIRVNSAGFTMRLTVEGWGTVQWWIGRTTDAYPAGGLGAFIKARHGQRINMLIEIL